jgi:hypothetical protein
MCVPLPLGTRINIFRAASRCLVWLRTRINVNTAACGYMASWRTSVLFRRLSMNPPINDRRLEGVTAGPPPYVLSLPTGVAPDLYGSLVDTAMVGWLCVSTLKPEMRRNVEPSPLVSLPPVILSTMLQCHSVDERVRGRCKWSIGERGAKSR